jgi:hypothetical protein
VRTGLYHNTTPTHRFNEIDRSVREAVRSTDGFDKVTFKYCVDGYMVCQQAFILITGAAPSTVRSFERKYRVQLKTHKWIGVTPAVLRAEVSECCCNYMFMSIFKLCNLFTLKQRKASRVPFTTEAAMMVSVWIKQWANTVGDLMPHLNEIRVPFFKWKDVYGEYVSDMRLKDNFPVAMKQFRLLWDKGYSKLIVLEKTHAKFAICNDCVYFQRTLAGVKKLEDRAYWVAQRKNHIDMQRAERQCYYEKREKARYAAY